MLAKWGCEMSPDVHDFLIRGHQKVIEHYNWLLSSPGVSEEERRVIISNLGKQQREFDALINVTRSIRMAS